MSSGIAADDGDQAPRRSARLAGSSPIKSTESARRTLQFKDTIIVRVGRGNEAVDFTVHEHKSRASSPFFEAALSKDWKEARERSIKLPEDDPEDFDMYMFSMYGGRNYEELMKGRGPQHAVHAYAFGEKVQARSFQNNLMKVLLASIHRSFGTLMEGEDLESAIMHLRWMVDIFYTRSPPMAPGRMLTADSGIVSFHREPTSINDDAWTVEFMKDVAASSIVFGAKTALVRSNREAGYFVRSWDK